VRPDPPVIEVFCAGSRGAPHDRFLIAAYRRVDRAGPGDDIAGGLARVHAVPTPTPAGWTALPSWGGMQLHPVERFAAQPDGSQILWFGLRCDRCGLDEQRKATPEFADAFYSTLDSLRLRGATDIEVRDLMRACRATDRHR
jgi:hypothetical protein